MTLNDYQQKRKQLLDEAQAAVNRNELDLCDQKTKMVESLDAQFNEEKARRDVLNAMSPHGMLPEGMASATKFEADSTGSTTLNATPTAFYNRVSRLYNAAGSKSTMTTVIPDSIMDTYVVENAPGAFLEDASLTYIERSGDLTLPVASLQAVAKHTENAAIDISNISPVGLKITHDEYAFLTAYSDLASRLSVNTLEHIISDTLLSSMAKKMDGVCLDAISMLNYVVGTSAIAIQKEKGMPAFADLVALAALLGPDYIGNAKWYVSSATYFNWMLGLVDDNGKPILDPSKPIEEQAPLGYHIRIDSQIPANIVYFGDGKRVHLNYARQPELNAWQDFEHNQQRFSIRAVAGAACETGAFVKMYVEQ